MSEKIDKNFDAAVEEALEHVEITSPDGEIQMKNEISIMWLDNPLKYSYLREAGFYSRFHEKFPSKGVKKADKNFRVLVGYTVHDPNGSRPFWRRFWYVRDYDLDHSVYPQGIGPSEAVEPRSIKVGVPSEDWDGSAIRAEEQEI